MWRRSPLIQMDGKWLCSTGCIEAEVHARFAQMSVPKEPVANHRVPLGLLMLARGFVSEEQLQTILAAQLAARGGKSAPGRRNLSLRRNARS